MMFRGFFSCQKGAAAAEMALILPLSLLLLFTSIEAGHYFYSQHQLVKAVRDGARFGARHSIDEVNCVSAISSALEADIRAVTLTGSLAGGSELRSGWDSSEIDFDVTVACPTTAVATSGIFEADRPAAVLTVTASIGYKSLFKGLGIFNDSFALNGNQNAVVMGI